MQIMVLILNVIIVAPGVLPHMPVLMINQESKLY